MASAEFSERRVAEIGLSLSEDEAQFLHYVLGRIGGDPELSVRRHGTAVRNALSAVLSPPTVKVGWRDYLRDALRNEGTLAFRNDSEVQVRP